MDRAGISQVKSMVTGRFRWIEREQNTSDYGIDLHVEQRDAAGQGNGRILALQVKSGPSYFRAAKRDGWRYYPKRRHVQYWLDNSLPVALVLVNPDAGEAYWVHVTAGTMATTSKGYRIFVPKSQKLEDALPSWTAIVDKSATAAEGRYAQARPHLPEQIASRLEGLPEHLRLPAHLLGITLGERRADAEAVVGEFSTNPPGWFELLGVAGQATVADFASFRGLRDTAISLYEAISTDDNSVATSCLLRKAALLGQRDPQAAADAREQLQELGEPARMSALALAAFGQDATDRRLPLSIDDIANSPGRDEHLVWAHAGQHLARTSQLDEAVEVMTELALRVRPRVPSWLISLARVLVLRSRRPNASSTDREAALRYAEQALDIALATLVAVDDTVVGAMDVFETTGAAVIAYRRALQVLEEYPQAINDGTRFTVASAAVRAGRFVAKQDRRLRDVLTSLGATDRRLSQLLSDLNSGKHTEAELKAAAERAVAAGEDATVAGTLFGLALMGRDYSDMLPDSSDPSFRSRIKDVTQAVTGSSVARGRLARASVTDRGAWEAYALVLSHLGRWDELLAALDRASAAFGEAAAQVHRVIALLNLERVDEAIAAAESALAEQPAVEAELRLREALAQALVSRRDVTRACRQLELALRTCEREGLPPLVAWDLAHLLARRRRREEAAAVLSRRGLEPGTLFEIGVWFNAQPPHAWTDASVSLALDLVERFPDEHGLSRAVLGRTMLETRDAQEPASSQLDPRSVIDGGLRLRIHEMIKARLATPSCPVRVISLDFDGDIRQQLIDASGPRLDQSGLRRSVLLGRLPAGLLTHLGGHPYGSVLLRGSIGPILATAVDEESYEADRQAAAAALGGRVVAEPSALVIAGKTGRFDEFAAEFTAVLTSPEVADDADETRTDIEGLVASSGLLDPHGQRLIRELTDEDRLRLRAGAADYSRAVTLCVIDPSIVGLPEIDDSVEDRAHDSWLNPLRLAKARGLPLWSDDFALRRLARALGIPAFGSVPLAEVLLERALEDAPDDDVLKLADAHAAWNVWLMREFVVYLPATAEELITLAQGDGFGVGAAALQVALGWRWQADLHGTMQLVSCVLTAVRREAPEKLQDWLLAVLEGVDELRAAEGANSDSIAAACGLLAIGDADTNTEHPLWRMTVDFCAARGIPSPDDARISVQDYVRERLGELNERAGTTPLSPWT